MNELEIIRKQIDEALEGNHSCRRIVITKYAIPGCIVSFIVELGHEEIWIHPEDWDSLMWSLLLSGMITMQPGDLRSRSLDVIYGVPVVRE